jgi:D-3-phosphoglycerate dehydrogenase
MNRKVVVTDYPFPNLEPERSILEPTGCIVQANQCTTEQQVIEVCKDADAILNQFVPITRAVLAELKRCKIIVRYGIGVDNVDVTAATEFGILVVNVPDYGIQEVADHTLSLLLSSIRKIPHINAQVQQVNWNNAGLPPMMGLRDKQAGLLGFGNIAKEVAKRLTAFNMKVSAYDPYVAEVVFQEHGVLKSEWQQLLKQSDVVCVHLPLNSHTKHFIRKETLQLMKPTAHLINTSRGGVIHTSDLAEALRSGVIAGAALDVLEEEPISKDNPLLGLSNCLLTSHVAWYSEDSIIRLQQYAAMEIRRYFNGELPLHIVNRELLK